MKAFFDSIVLGESKDKTMIVEQGSCFLHSSANCETHRAIKMYLILNGTHRE